MLPGQYIAHGVSISFFPKAFFSSNTLQVLSSQLNRIYRIFSLERCESQLGQEPELQPFATKNLPIFQRHLQLEQCLLTQPTPQSSNGDLCPESKPEPNP